MGIAITIVVVVALLIAARSAIKSYRVEVSKGSPLPNSSIDAMIFSDDEPSTSDSPHSHGGHHFDPGCVDSHHSGCEVGGHDSFDAGHGDFGGHH